MRVSPAIVNDHGGDEGYEVEDNEHGNDPCIASSSARAGFEERRLEVLKRVDEIQGRCRLRLRRRVYLDVGIQFGRFFHFPCARECEA